MIMKDISKIEIPEGEVSKITSSEGTLWEGYTYGTYTVSLTRANAYITVPAESNIKSQIASSIGVSSDVIEILSRKYTLSVYRASNASYGYILFNKGTTRDETNNKMYITYINGTGKHEYTFRFDDSDVTQIRGYQGNSSTYSTITTAFNTTYNYFRSSYGPWEVEISYRYKS